MKDNLETFVGRLRLKNPLILASGTAGYGIELKDYIDYNEIGAFVSKGIHYNEKSGNPSPRIYETPCGMINSIGLQGIGVKRFKNEVLPFWEEFKTLFGVNVSGDNEEEFARVVRYLSESERIDFFEINLSCPNLKEGGVSFSLFPEKVEKIIKLVRNETDKPLWAKLSPQVTFIEEIVEASIKGGAEAVVLANTYVATAIDVEKREPKIANIFGGLSGPAIKPITLALVLKVAKKFDIPIVASGGVFSGYDVLEYITAGASAVEIGTLTLTSPSGYKKVLEEVEGFMKKFNIGSIIKLKGSVKV